MSKNPAYPYGQLVLPHLGQDNSGKQQQENNQVLQRAFNLLQQPEPSTGPFGFMLVASDPALGESGNDISQLVAVEPTVYQAWASSILLPYNADPVIGGIAGEFTTSPPGGTIIQAVAVVSNADGSSLLNCEGNGFISGTAYVIEHLNLSQAVVGSDLSIGGTNDEQVLSAAGGTYSWQVWITVET